MTAEAGSGGIDDDVIDMTKGADAAPAPTEKRATAPVTDPIELDEDVAEPTVMDDLEESLAEILPNPELMLRVPARKNMVLVYDPNIEYGIVRRFYVQAGSETKDGVDQLQLSYMVLSHLNSGIRIRGVLWQTEDGRNVTLKSTELHKRVGARDTADAIYRLFGQKTGEGHLINHCDRVLEAAGYGDPKAIGLDPLGV